MSCRLSDEGTHGSPAPRAGEASEGLRRTGRPREGALAGGEKVLCRQLLGGGRVRESWADRTVR